MDIRKIKKLIEMLQESDLTEIEKKNIQLLLKYEDHAEEYYDEFGRG